MQILMAVAPNGGIAIKNLNSSKAQAIEGLSYDPFGDTWHSTGRRPYLPAKTVANMILSEQDNQWKPTDAQQLAELLEPQQVVTLNQDPSLDTAHQVAAEEHDPYLMAMAAAKVVMRNIKTGAMTATFHDDSKAKHPLAKRGNLRAWKPDAERRTPKQGIMQISLLLRKSNQVLYLQQEGSHHLPMHAAGRHGPLHGVSHQRQM